MLLQSKGDHELLFDFEPSFAAFLLLHPLAQHLESDISKHSGLGWEREPWGACAGSATRTMGEPRSKPPGIGGQASQRG